MPRRRVFSIKMIYELRASSWERHYQLRAQARVIGASDRVQSTLRLYVPDVELGIDGDVIHTRELLCAQNRAAESLRFSNTDLMLGWYWNEANWACFVRAFQALPDVLEDYYLRYDRAGDVGILVPMSSKPKQGSGSGGAAGSRLVDKWSCPVDKSSKSVDKPVSNFGTFTSKKVHLARFPALLNG